MPKRNRVGFCPNCKQNVLLVRNRCIHCHTQISLNSYKNVQASTHLQTENQIQHKSDINSDIKVEANEISKPKYCSYCNEPLLNESAKFCAHCGSTIK